MQKESDKRPYFTISVKLLCAIVLTVGSIAGLLLYDIQQSRSILLRHVNETHENMLKSYMTQLDTQLSAASAYASGLVTQEDDAMIIAIGSGANVKYATVRLLNQLKKDILTADYMDGVFFLARQDTDDPVFMNVSSANRSAVPDAALRDFLGQYIKEESLAAQWRHVRIQDDDVLLYFVKGADLAYAGFYVKLNSILSYFSHSGVSDGRIGICSGEMMETIRRQLPDNTELIFCPSETANLYLTEELQRDHILSALPFMQKYITLIAVIVCALTILLLLVIRRLVVAPLKSLSKAMLIVQHGDLDYQLPVNRSSKEVFHVDRSFNEMVSQIRNLRIENYEQKLNVQKAQLRMLQLQIRPHFLINSLNLIHNLIENGHTDHAIRLIRYTAEYFRYMVRVDKDLVPLNEEIQHVRSYVEIQTIRYQKRFQFDIYVDPMIEDILIPPLSLQAFVENSMKYALGKEDCTKIQIDIRSFERDYFPYAEITMRDSGPGYPEEDLQKMNAGEKIVHADGSHIGISNTIQRLSIRFGSGFSYHFSNENGAVCRYTFPAVFSEDELHPADAASSESIPLE